MAPLDQKRKAQRLVQHARKRMRRVHGDRREQRLEFPFAVVVHERQCRLIQFVDAEHANSLLRQFRPQALVPAGILLFDELVGRMVDQFALLDHGQPVGSGGIVAVFELLQQAADPNLEKFVEVAGGNGEKFHPFEQRIAEIVRFFKHTPVELQPRGFAVEKRSAIAESLPDHSLSNHIVYRTIFIESCVDPIIDLHERKGALTAFAGHPAEDSIPSWRRAAGFELPLRTKAS